MAKPRFRAETGCFSQGHEGRKSINPDTARGRPGFLNADFQA
jgi:hypothetical protein